MDVIILAVIVVFLSVIWYLTRPKRKYPPAPRGIPILGNIDVFSPNKSVQTFRRLHREFGDIFSLYILNKHIIVIGGYNTIKELLVKNADVSSDRPYSFLAAEILTNIGLSSSSGQLWKEHRTFAVNTLRAFGFGKKSLEGKISEEVVVFLEELDKTNGQATDIHRMLNISVSNIIVSMIVGQRFDHCDPHFNKIIHLVDETTRRVGLESLLNFIPTLKYLPGDFFKYKETMKLFEELFTILHDFVEEHRKSFDPNNMRDYIDYYLLEQSKKESDGTEHTFSDKQLLTSLTDLLAAGTETTTTAIRWGVLFLLHHPDVQMRMLKEIESVIGSNTPSIQDKPNLPYCEAFCYETLRRGTVAYVALPHAVSRDIEIQGYTISKNSTILIDIDSTCFDPGQYPDPQSFKPERFLNEKGELTGTDKTAVFSMGRRVCLGEAAAKMELFLFMASLVQKFEIQNEAGKALPSLQGLTELTNSPQPYNVCFIKR